MLLTGRTFAPSGGDDFWAARITLLALRSHVSPSRRIEGYALAPSDSAEAPEHVAEVLARLAKPLQCDGTVKGRVLVAQCVPDRAEGPVERSPGAAFVRQEVRARCKQSATALILLKTRYESLTVPVGALEAWMRDYSVAHVLSQSPKRDSIALPPGVCLALDLGGPPKVWLKVVPDSNVRS